MKPQDIVFGIVLVLILVLRKQKLSIIVGLSCLLLAIPLFAKWIFFTGERLTWYAAAFLFVGIIEQLFTKEKHV